jgi:hypothetical protein
MTRRVPALALGDPAKAEANKAGEQKKKETEEVDYTCGPDNMSSAKP